MLSYLGMFSSSFFVVFLLGLQSKNVNQSRYVAAMLTSIGISVSQFAFTKYAAHGGLLEFSVMAAGGALGIASSIAVHDHIVKRRNELERIKRNFIKR